MSSMGLVWNMIPQMSSSPVPELALNEKDSSPVSFGVLKLNLTTPESEAKTNIKEYTP